MRVEETLPELLVKCKIKKKLPTAKEIKRHYKINANTADKLPNNSKRVFFDPLLSRAD